MARRDIGSKIWWMQAAGFAVSAVLLTIIQAPWNVHFLAWAAWVPFVLACGPDVGGRRLFFSAYLVALGYWLFNLWWLTPVTLPGYITFSLWQALYWPVLALCVRYVRRKNWPLTVCVPIIVVGAEAIQGWLFTGFGWFFLAHSQYRVLPLIQICDLFGALGVSVLIALVNGLIADGIVEWTMRRRVGKLFGVKAVIAASLIAGTLGYGRYRLEQTPQFVSEGPVLGSVQPNVPSFVKEETDNAQAILDDLIEKSQACIDAGAKLVAWPETMVLATLNPGYLKYWDANSEPQLLHRRILAHAEGQAYILFGAHSATVGADLTITDQFNTAFLYRPDGTPDLQRYDKIHLVPFGEYIPLRRSVPWIYRMILFLSPYEYDYNLTPGEHYTIFAIDDNGKTRRFGVLICYEDTSPTVTRRIAAAENGVKQAEWLVNISNDGWYVRYRDGKIIPSAEMSQRMAISVFRCIENRIAIIRSVNTGISCLIESTGHIRDTYRNGTLPAAVIERQGVDGWFTDSIPIDSRITLFNRYGRRLDIVFGAGFAGLCLRGLLERNKKHGKGEQKK